MKKQKTCLLLFIALLIFSITSPAFGGSNSKAKCSIDMDIRTEGIESDIVAMKDDMILIAVIAENVYNLNTYQVEIEFDPNILEFHRGYEDSAYAGINNILKKNGGNSLGFQAIDKKPGVINVANAMTGKSSKKAPEGSGVLAIIQFKLLSKESTRLSLRNVHFIDSNNSIDQIRLLTDGHIN